MMALILLLCTITISVVKSTSWKPRWQTVYMKDFVNSHNLPIVSPPSGTSGFSSRKQEVNAIIPDDLSRGGHASLKKMVDRNDFNDTTAISKEVTTNSSEEPLEDVTQQPNVLREASKQIQTLDVHLNHEGEEKQKKLWNSAARIAKKLKSRNHTNIRRKLLHMAFGFFFASLHHMIPKSIFLKFTIGVSSVALAVELLRYRKGFQWMNDIIFHIVGDGVRKHEMEGKFTGSFYYFVGVTLTSMLYSKPCATLGIIQLALADPAASYFGTKTKHVYWSRIENGLGGFGRNKGILGFLGGALFCVPFNYRLLSCAKFSQSMFPSKTTRLAASLAFGLAGAFADLAVPTPALTLPKRIMGRRVPPFHVDDNFVVPVFSGLICTEVFKYLGWSLDLEFAKYLVL